MHQHLIAAAAAQAGGYPRNDIAIFVAVLVFIVGLGLSKAAATR